jgi:mRNA interferase RelE/StbE
VRARYAVTFARSARKELEALDPPLVARILARIEALADEPRPPGCRKLRGAKNLWRLRVRDYRVIYAVSDRERVVDVVAVRHRREAYE